MSQQSTFEIVKAILVDDLGIDENQVTEDAHLQEGLELDSTDTVEIALQLKKRLHIDVKLQLRDDPTISQLCDQVDRAVGGEPPHSSTPSSTEVSSSARGSSS